MNSLNIFQNIIDWLLSSGVKIILILFGALLVNRSLMIFIEKIVNKQIESRINGGKKKKAETLIGIFGGTLRFIIWIAAVLMILPEFGINVAPILAGLGLVGLAVGMAARDIISDFISGLFILLEGQYNLGDKVKIAGLEGEVKEITLRRTTIKDEAGVLHSIPNGQIKIVAKKEN